MWASDTTTAAQPCGMGCAPATARSSGSRVGGSDERAALDGAELVKLRLAGPLGAHEGGVQEGDPFRLQAVVAPGIERNAESRPLLSVELNGPARPDRLETLANRLRPLGEGELLEQYIALVPADHDDLARKVDVHAIEPARFHAWRAYSGAAA